MEDVGGLRRPGGNRALAWSDKEPATILLAVKVVLGTKECECALGGGVVEGAIGLDEIDFGSVNFGDIVAINRFVKCCFKRLEAKIGEWGRALENDRLHAGKKLGWQGDGAGQAGKVMGEISLTAKNALEEP
jgi:hypothetical protein